MLNKRSASKSVSSAGNFIPSGGALGEKQCRETLQLLQPSLCPVSNTTSLFRYIDQQPLGSTRGGRGGIPAWLLQTLTIHSVFSVV